VVTKGTERKKTHIFLGRGTGDAKNGPQGKFDSRFGDFKQKIILIFLSYFIE